MTANDFVVFVYDPTADMQRLAMHEALTSLAWLEGTWITQGLGAGKFPTIKPFNYCEEISFSSIGQPMFNYVSQTWHPELKKPMHREVGFLKVIPGTNKVQLVLSHNFGLNTVEEGEVTDKALVLKSTSISRPSECTKPPAVTELRRELKLDGDSLRQIVYMATATTPTLTEHLCATYVKKD